MTKIRVVINWYRFPITINRLIDIDWLQFSSRFKIYKLTEYCINITSLYALIVNTFYLNVLNVNMRTILPSSSYYNAPSTCIRFPLKTQKFLSVFAFLPHVSHENGNQKRAKHLKTLSLLLASGKDLTDTYIKTAKMIAFI